MDNAQIIAHYQSAEQSIKDSAWPLDRRYWEGRKEGAQICIGQDIQVEEMKSFLDHALGQHARIVHKMEKAYWQGRKDALRVLLAEALNDPGYIEQINSSVFSFEKAHRAFTPVRPEELTSPEQCIECGGKYFHHKGCLRGAGLTDEEFAERIDAVERWMAHNAPEAYKRWPNKRLKQAT